MRFTVCFVLMLLCVALECQRGVAGLVVNWAMDSTPGGSGTTLAPDGQFASLTDLAPTITTSNFGLQTSYNNLEFLLNIPFATLAKAEVIAWEGNAGSAAVGGGWEATRFILFDDRVSLTIDHFEGALQPGVIATGTVEGFQYESFFGLQTGAAQGKMSWILLDNVSDLVDTRSAFFGIQMTAGHSLGFAGEGTADPDAIGVFVTAVPEPSSIILVGLLFSLVGTAKLRKRIMSR